MRAGLEQDFDAAVAVERAEFRALVEDPRSKALRYAFFAEREAARVPGLPKDTPRRPIRTAAVIGAGTMGGGIAMCFANAGIGGGGRQAFIDRTEEAWTATFGTLVTAELKAEVEALKAAIIDGSVKVADYFTAK